MVGDSPTTHHPPPITTTATAMLRHHRIGLVHAALALLAVAVLAKTGYVQLIQGRAWSDLARRQHFTAKAVPACQGTRRRVAKSGVMTRSP